MSRKAIVVLLLKYPPAVKVQPEMGDVSDLNDFIGHCDYSCEFSFNIFHDVLFVLPLHTNKCQGTLSLPTVHNHTNLCLSASFILRFWCGLLKKKKTLVQFLSLKFTSFAIILNRWTKETHVKLGWYQFSKLVFVTFPNKKERMPK